MPLSSHCRSHGALGLQVFGSVAQGSARPGSDLDRVVEFPASTSSVPVDLVIRRGLRAELRQRTEDEAIVLMTA